MTGKLLEDLDMSSWVMNPELDFEPWPSQPKEVKDFPPSNVYNILDEDPLGSISKAGSAKAPKTSFASVKDEAKKAELKKKMNKIAADKYRRKKREQFEDLQERSEQLTETNRMLTNKCSVLEVQVAYLKDLLMAAVSSNSNNGGKRRRNPSISTLDFSSTLSPSSSSSSSSTSSPSPSSPDSSSQKDFDLESFAKNFIENRVKQTELRLQALESEIKQLSGKQ